MTDEQRREKETESGAVKCPICGEGELEQEFCDVCSRCGWRYDKFSYIYHDEGGVNVGSVNQLRRARKEMGKDFTVKKYVEGLKLPPIKLKK